jgi:RNA polymerase primary sigma factor
MQEGYMTSDTTHAASLDNPVAHYFRQIRDLPRLTRFEEQELSIRSIAGDEAARHELTVTNLRLVIKIAKIYIGSGIPFLDIIQEGNVGLIQAASRYDYRKNAKFSTYSSWWIRQTIIRFINANKRMVPLPYRKEVLLYKMKQAAAELSHRLTREPTMSDLAWELHLKIDDVKNVLLLAGNDCSLNHNTDASSGELMDSYIDETYSPECEYIEKSMREETQKMLGKLPAMERQVLLYRFFHYGEEKLSLRQIGERYNVSPETIRQVEKRALHKLRIKAPDMAEFLMN